ncbi:MAG: hypothetical protein KBT05_01595 [Bacteroidales bacterium]|nr:hypothetical protein [Candidatus Cryptobacteroides caccocaballi]
MASGSRRKYIDCPEAMIETVREFGIIPFFRNPVPGWSIEDMTAPGCWFDTDGVLGPWDWKIEVVRDGIAYGKMLGDRAAFATEEWYRELMNYRRSLPKYRIALGEKPRAKATSKHEKLLRMLSKPALDAIRQSGALESRQLRMILSESITPAQIRSLGASYKKLLVPAVKKSISDSVLTYLQMGTWCLVGDIERVYRGPDLVYSGWQTSSNTTPEQYFDNRCSPSEGIRPDDDMPSWARRFMDDEPVAVQTVLGTPEESRIKIVSHIHELFPEADIAAIEKLV